MTTTQRAAARVIDAWDSTVLPVANDGRLQEAMEDLRAALAAMADTPTLREAAQQALVALETAAPFLPGVHSTGLVDMKRRVRESITALRSALAEQAAEQASPAYLAEPGAAQATRADLVANWPEHNRARMTVALHYAAPAAEQAEPHVWTRVVDEALTLYHLDVANESDDYATARGKMENLLAHAGNVGAYHAAEQAEPYTYASTQSTKCASCGERKHTPLRIDAMGGYVCLTCIDQKLGSLLGAFGYPSAEQAEPVALDVTLTEEETQFLRDTMVADEDEGPDPIRLIVGRGHSGYGLYVSLAEYGDEGSSLLKALVPPPAPARQEPLTEAQARPLDEWDESNSDVLWWRFPIDKPPYVGHPNCDDWPGYHTHWTPLIVPAAPAEGGA